MYFWIFLLYCCLLHHLLLHLTVCEPQLPFVSAEVCVAVLQGGSGSNPCCWCPGCGTPPAVPAGRDTGTVWEASAEPAWSGEVGGTLLGAAGCPLRAWAPSRLGKGRVWRAVQGRDWALFPFGCNYCYHFYSHPLLQGMLFLNAWTSSRALPKTSPVVFWSMCSGPWLLAKLLHGTVQ